VNVSELAAEAREYAICHGILRYREGQIAHLPITLRPCSLPQAFYEQGRQATLLFNYLYHEAARRDFLEEHLGAARDADPFVANLFEAWPRDAHEKPTLYLTRNDYMPSQDGARQVEANLMAASLAAMSERVDGLVRYLYQGESLNLPVNRSGTKLTRCMAETFHRYKKPGSRILFVIPPGESNAFDQRVLQTRLQVDHDIPVRRVSLQELGEGGELRAGDLYYGGAPVTLVYFRAGYTPDHYPTESCWRARRLIEESSAISVPSVATQLVNTKKIQQVLNQRDVLLQFLDPQAADVLQNAQVRLASLDQKISWRGQEASAREIALAHPEEWVLKPFREGGGNNFFGAELVQQLRRLDAAEAQAYVLMEMIRQTPFRGVRLVQEQVLDSSCVTEMGHYTAHLREPGRSAPLIDELLGYLLRSKDAHSSEAFVLGDHSYLDAVTLA
jgi:glutathione synthase